MKLTNIRIIENHVKGSQIGEEDKLFLHKPAKLNLMQLCDYIVAKMDSIGFETDAIIINSQSIKVGINQRQFQVNVNKLGYNTQHRPGHKKRTNLPSWNQRVEFNDTLNALLDNLGYSANIKSGEFIIREGLDSMTERDWVAQTPQYLIQNAENGYFVAQGDYKANPLNKFINRK